MASGVLGACLLDSRHAGVVVLCGEVMRPEREIRWMPAWLALVRTHTRLWDQVEAQMRRDNGLTMARYDVLAHLDMADG